MKKLVLILLVLVLVAPVGTAGAEQVGMPLVIVGERTRIEGNYCVFDRFDALANGDRTREFRRILSLGFSLADAVEYAVPGLGRELREAILKEEQPPRDATLDFDGASPESPFSYGAHVVGRKVNEDRLLRDVLDYLEGKRNRIVLEVLKIEPRQTTRALRERTALLGTYTTDYSRSSEGRTVNVQLATRAISGTVLMPGEQFSFNRVVGPRTEERGYQGAKVIVSGKYVDGVGGGVCQVSTTLYNAVLRAGLKIGEVRCHSLAPTYVPLSYDAMVSAYSDFTFTNTLSVPVYVTGSARDGRLTFNVFGLEERGYKSEFLSHVIRAIDPPPRVEITDEGLPEGATVIERAISGAESEAYEHRAYPNGRSVLIKLRRDVYGARQEVVRRGPTARAERDEISDQAFNKWKTRG